MMTIPRKRGGSARTDKSGRKCERLNRNQSSCDDDGVDSCFRAYARNRSTMSLEAVHPSRRINFGADPPRNSRKVDPDSLLPNDSLDATSLRPATLTNGIHPSRLALFDAQTSTKESDPVPDAIMVTGQTPEPHTGHPQHQSLQAKTTVNGSNLNGEYHHELSQSRSNYQQGNLDKNLSLVQGNGTRSIFIGPGPMPNHIQVAKPFVFQQAIEGCLRDVGVSQVREDSIRLAGVQWIDNVRRALKLPVRTFDSAVIYYHKFRLVHSDGEYNFVDAAAAALFAACKTEDTLRKSRDILCAAHNLKLQNRSEHLSPDDNSFEHHSRSIIGLERLMLESSSFDFRNRHPQALLMKLAKFYGIKKTSSMLRTAYTILLDAYRTFAPLKQCTATLAFACLELSARLGGEVDNHPGLQDIASGRDYDKWKISRAEVMETLLDLLELYTHYRTSTAAGSDFSLDTFLDVRIPLNNEMKERKTPRFTEYVAQSNLNNRVDIGSYAATVNGVPAANPAVTSTPVNGTSRGDPSPISPSTPGGRPNNTRQKAGERGREGTVRFMLNPDREQQERAVVAEYNIQPQSTNLATMTSAPYVPHQPSGSASGTHTPTLQGAPNRSKT